jgi:hypothetical protein
MNSMLLNYSYITHDYTFSNSFYSSNNVGRATSSNYISSLPEYRPPSNVSRILKIICLWNEGKQILRISDFSALYLSSLVIKRLGVNYTEHFSYRDRTVQFPPPPPSPLLLPSKLQRHLLVTTSNYVSFPDLDNPFAFSFYKPPNSVILMKNKWGNWLRSITYMMFTSWSYGLWHHATWYLVSNISEEHIASIYFEYGFNMLLWNVGNHLPKVTIL